jgi:hypothetical protein
MALLDEHSAQAEVLVLSSRRAVDHLVRALAQE